MKIIFAEEFGKAFIPVKIRPHIRKYLLKAGITEVPYTAFGVMFYISLILTYSVFIKGIYPYLIKGGYKGVSLLLGTFGGWVGVQLAIVALIMSAIYFYFDMKIFHRTKQMEKVLIEFLQFVSQNLKGGMPFDRALWSSVKPRFSVLASEVKIAAKKAMTGEDVEEALMELTEKYESPMLKRAFSLIVEGMRGGGQIAEIIDKVVENLKRTRELKEEMTATALGYVIFVTIIVLIISPGLFALSKQLLMVLGNFATKLGSSMSTAGSSMPISFKEVSITPENFRIFSIGSLSVISIFSAMIISIIQNGDIKSGMKYVPFFVIISYVVYTIFSAILGFVMGGLFSAI
ncbi:type II secretion system F family protein [Nanoarchaeota archaeon]